MSGHHHVTEKIAEVGEITSTVYGFEGLFIFISLCKIHQFYDDSTLGIKFISNWVNICLQKYSEEC